MKTLVVVALLFAAVYGFSVTSQRTHQEYQDLFINWMQEHKKSYNAAEFRYRFRVFQNNLDYVDSFNAANLGFQLGMNKFGDLTNEEYRNLYCGYRMAENMTEHYKYHRPTSVYIAPSALPTSWDWRQQGAVTHVKDQGQCGSCWSFSTTGSTEGCHKIVTGSLVGVSEQNLVDCSSNVQYGNHGCNGGLMTNAMNYIISNGGIDTESSYPYTASQGTCHYNSANKGATLKSYYNIAKGSESDLQNQVYVGPVSVAIDASQSSFQFYKSGVYYEPKCSSTNLDHGVLAIGWGVDGGQDYWWVKNSWGTGWGQAGYIEMARNKNNNCGIATQATRPNC
jgi:cathepsin L